MARGLERCSANGDSSWHVLSGLLLGGYGATVRARSNESVVGRSTFLVRPGRKGGAQICGASRRRNHGGCRRVAAIPLTGTSGDLSCFSVRTPARTTNELVTSFVTGEMNRTLMVTTQPAGM